MRVNQLIIPPTCQPVQLSEIWIFIASFQKTSHQKNHLKVSAASTNVQRLGICYSSCYCCCCCCRYQNYQKGQKICNSEWIASWLNPPLQEQWLIWLSIVLAFYQFKFVSYISIISVWCNPVLNDPLCPSWVATWNWNVAIRRRRRIRKVLDWKRI